MQKCRAKQSVFVMVFKRKVVILHSAQQNIIFQHYYQSYYHNLLRMGRMDEEEAVFEQ